jgi:hypothetical protein
MRLKPSSRSTVSPRRRDSFAIASNTSACSPGSTRPSSSSSASMRTDAIGVRSSCETVDTKSVRRSLDRSTSRMRR